MPRPQLTPQISVADFRAYYWMKDELAYFCHQNGLSPEGSKQELTHRIAKWLETGEKDATIAPRPAPFKMPEEFTRESVIGKNWRCSEPLRAFFVAEIGANFHFNQVLRDFIREGEGHTLEEAIQLWYSSLNQPTKIGRQFEYNQHMRDFFEQNPKATRQEALQAWWEKRAQRRTSDKE